MRTLKIFSSVFLVITCFVVIGNVHADDGTLGNSLSGGTFNGANITDGSITDAQLAPNSVDATKLAHDGGIGSNQVDGSVQKRITGSCSGNQFITRIFSDGTVTCGTPPPAPSCSGATPYGTFPNCTACSANAGSTISGPTLNTSDCKYYKVVFACNGIDNVSEYTSDGLKDCAGVCGGNAIDYNGSIAGCGTPPPAPSCSGTLPQNATSNATSPSGTWNYSSTPGACTFACNSNYTWSPCDQLNGICVIGQNYCKPNSKTVSCGGSMPVNTVSSTDAFFSSTISPIVYDQTWNGSVWSPVTNFTYATSASISGYPYVVPCLYECKNGYTWNGGQCVQNTGMYCGTSNGIYTTTQPTINLCIPGATVTSGGVTVGSSSSTWKWGCTMDKIYSAACFTPSSPTTGSCGSAATTYLYSKPTTNLCVQGLSTPVTGDGSSGNPWAWKCSTSQDNGGGQLCAAYLHP